MIVKVGGGAAINHRQIAADLAAYGGPAVVVHGANAVRDRLARDLGTPVESVTSLSGYSSVLTDTTTMNTILMAYAGLVNKRLVGYCQEQGVNAVGLSGADGRLIVGRRNAGIRTLREGRKMILHDLSGKPAELNTTLLELLLENGYTPVLTIPILDEQGCLINTENDEIVVLLHAALGADLIVHLIEAPGLLADPADPGSLVQNLTAADLESWEQRVTGRMKRKLMALRKLFGQGATRVIIGDGRVERPISSLLAGGGTHNQ